MNKREKRGESSFNFNILLGEVIDLIKENYFLLISLSKQTFKKNKNERNNEQENL